MRVKPGLPRLRELFQRGRLVLQLPLPHPPVDLPLAHAELAANQQELLPGVGGGGGLGLLDGAVVGGLLWKWGNIGRLCHGCVCVKTRDTFHYGSTSYEIIRSG